MKKIISGLLSISVCLSAAAATITPEAALSRLNKDANGKMKLSSNMASPKLLHTFNDEKGEPALYVFTYSGDKGFMILPAEDKVKPLLAYSETNSFGIPGLALEDNPFIKQYVSEVYGAKMYAPAYQTPADDSYSETWDYIAPMRTPLWNQGSPYNKFVLNNMTGCIATAMAEVMKYWEYPERGRGTVKVTPLTLVLDDNPFDWSNMLYTYNDGYNEAEADAVALLMEACGLAMNLNYRPGGTGGDPNNIPGVLVDYFLYDKGATNYFKSNYSTDYQWNEALYNNLKNYGPVIYSDNDHTYVCEGYNGQGLFYFNLGGSGAWNAWYTPSASHYFAHGDNYQEGFGFHQFAGNLRPSIASLNVASASVNGVALSAENTTTVDNINYLSLDLNLGYASTGLMDSYLYLTITDAVGTVVNTILGDRVTQQYGNIELSNQFILPTLETGTDYTLTLQYNQYGSSELTTLGTYVITGAEAQAPVNPWEGVSFVDVDKNGLFTIELTDLTANTDYSYKLYAVAGDFVSEPMPVTFTTDKSVGIDSLLNSDEPVRFFNLQGVEIAKPAPGTICIIRKGNQSFKAIIK